MVFVATGSVAPKVMVVTKVVDGRTTVCVRTSSWRILRGEGASVGAGGRRIISNVDVMLVRNVCDGGYWVVFYGMNRRPDKLTREQKERRIEEDEEDYAFMGIFVKVEGL